MGHLNIDLTRTAFINTADIAWEPSRVFGGEVKYLERFGNGRSRSTCLIRYQAEQTIAAIDIRLGSEMYVVSGAFSNDQGTHRTGSYIRNPAGISRGKALEGGVVIFCKTGHYQELPGDIKTLDTHQIEWTEFPDYKAERAFLHVETGNSTALIRTHPNTDISKNTLFGGYEIYLLEGHQVYEVDGIHYDCYPGCWLRMPHNRAFRRRCENGALSLCKFAHLPVC